MNFMYDPQVPELICKYNDGLIVYKDPLFYSKHEADKLFNQLLNEIIFDDDSYIVIYGKKIKIPRKQTAYGDNGTSYSFSGTTVNARKWTPILLKIKNDVEKMSGKKFNFCLVNYYETGKNYIGYHKDDEQDLGKAPWIASVSFGQSRKFYFKSDNSKLSVVKTTLNHGCLCLMIHPTNLYWKHSVPKELTVNKPRINLTFRWINVPTDSDDSITTTDSCFKQKNSTKKKIIEI